MSKSGVWIESRKLEAWCLVVLKNIKEERKRTEDRYIQNIVDRKNKNVGKMVGWFFKKVSKQKSVTFDEILIQQRNLARH